MDTGPSVSYSPYGNVFSEMLTGDPGEKSGENAEEVGETPRKIPGLWEKVL